MVVCRSMDQMRRVFSPALPTSTHPLPSSLPPTSGTSQSPGTATLVTLKPHTTAAITCVAWNCDGTRLAAGSVDHFTRVYDPALSSSSNGGATMMDEKTPVLTLRGHTAAVSVVAWSSVDRDILATCGADRTVRIWDMRSKKCVEVVSTSGENINAAWSPDGKYLAVGNKNDIITFYDTSTYKPFHTLPKPSHEINQFAWTQDMALFMMTTNLGHIKTLFWPPSSTSASSTTSATTQQAYGPALKAHTSVAYCMDMGRRGQHCVVGSADATVSVWDTHELLCARTFSRSDAAVRTVGLSHDEQFAACGLEDGCVDIASVSTGELVVTIKGGLSLVNGLAWNPRRLAIAYAGDAESEPARSSARAAVSGTGVVRILYATERG